MKIVSGEDRPTRQGSPEWFTGTVWVDDIVVGAAPSRLHALRVSFAPGARTAWHTHPVGQTLHILSGVGRVQRAGGPVLVVRPGDTIQFEPGEKHWHGAAPEQAMVHLAIQERDAEGSEVAWFERVADRDYNPEKA